VWGEERNSGKGVEKEGITGEEEGKRECGE
jgi:hypothetical protein